MRTCKTCPKRATCHDICPAVEALLPPVERGRLCALRRETALEGARRLTEELEAARYLTSRRDRLSGHLREVFDLRYNDGLTQQQIAERMGVKQRTVGRWLEAATQAIMN
jgi:RNA polymerase sigma factor (sigma-70 family)